jgi:hypothetical protein
MARRPGFDPFRERPLRGKMGLVLFGVALLLVLAAPAVSIEPTPGVSGALYRVYEEHRIWRAVGPALSIRYRTEHRDRSAAKAEAADLLPVFAVRADSADVRHLIIRATRPIATIGHRFGVYRAWNFRYERGNDGWVSSGYW